MLVFAIPRSTASLFAPLKLFLSAFTKLELMEGGGQTQTRLYNSYNGLSCYCFLTGRDFPCIRSAFQLLLFTCWGLGSICSRKWFELCEIWQKSGSERTAGFVNAIALAGQRVWDGSGMGCERT